MKMLLSGSVILTAVFLTSWSMAVALRYLSKCFCSKCTNYIANRYISAAETWCTCGVIGIARMLRMFCAPSYVPDRGYWKNYY